MEFYAIKYFLQLPKRYCIIIIGDIKTPDNNFNNFNNSRLLFLNSKIQKEIFETDYFITKIPWNSFARKNIGYIMAIAAKAKAIWDMDDDNIITSKYKFIEIMEKKTNKHSIFEVKNCTIINPLLLFLKKSKEYEYFWPRGFPLEKIKSSSHIFKIVNQKKNIHIWQSLANYDPDVDAILRLTKNHNIFFENNIALALNPNQFTPLNAQASVFFPDSYFALFLPFTVHGRVSDIWRGYIAQALLSKLNGTIIVSSPIVIQKRNSHNYLADFISEKNLYEQSSNIIHHLKNMSKINQNLNIKDIYINLYERGFIEAADVDAVDAWIYIINFFKI